MSSSVVGKDIPLPTVQALRGEGWRTPEIRSSAIYTRLKCPRKFLLSDKLGIQPKRYEGALSRGTMYHKMRECLLQGKTAEESQAVCSGLLEEAIVKVTGDAGKDGRLPDGKDAASTVTTMRDDFHIACAMAIAVWEMYPLDFSSRWKIAEHDGVPLVEAKYSVQVEGVRTPCTVKFDCVLEHQQGGDLWIIDEKTTSLDPQIRASSMSFSLQTQLYRLVLTQLLGPERGSLVRGAVHNIIRTPSIKYCSKDASFADYVARVKQWYKDGKPPGTCDPRTGEGQRVLQSWTRFSDHPLPPEFKTLLHGQDVASRARPMLDNFPRNDGACYEFNRPCPYLPMCTSDEAMWPGLLERLYEIRFRADEED